MRHLVRGFRMKSAAPEKVSGVGLRLAQIRTGTSQPDRAEQLGVHKNTYARWERGETSISAEGLEALMREGWNANWILTGEGPQRLEDTRRVADQEGSYAGSQELSEEAITIALQITDDIIRDEGARYVPRVLYGRLFRLMLEGITQGLPVADVYDVGRGSFRGSISGHDAEGGDDGKQEVGRTGSSGNR